MLCKHDKKKLFTATSPHDMHGKDCSCKPVASPPSMEVRCANVAGVWIHICPWMDGSRLMQEQLPRSELCGKIVFYK